MKAPLPLREQPVTPRRVVSMPEVAFTCSRAYTNTSTSVFKASQNRSCCLNSNSKTHINEPVHPPSPSRQRTRTVARPKQLEELARAMRAGRLLRRKVIIVERDGGDARRNGDRRSANGDDGGERRAAGGGLFDGRGVADALAGDSDGDGERGAGQGALDGVGGAREVAELVLLEDLGDFLGAAVELGLGGDVGAGGCLEGVGERGVVYGWVGGGNGAGLAGGEVGDGVGNRVGVGGGGGS